MLPRTQLALAKALWLFLCVLVLVFAWNNRNGSNTDIAVFWMLLVLTFPIALTVASLGAGLFFLLYRYAGFVVPGGFWFNVTYWVISVGGAYWFWFLFMPRVTRREP